MEKKQSSKVFWIILAVIAAIIIAISIFDMTGPTEVKYSSFKNLLTNSNNQQIKESILKDIQ